VAVGFPSRAQAGRVVSASDPTTSFGDRTIVRFRGGVSCRRESGTPLSLTLIGRGADRPDEALAVAFSGAAPEDLPEVLEDVHVERGSDNSYRIITDSRQWVVAASAVHVHRDVSTVFYRAVAPRRPRMIRKILLTFVLTLAHSATGKRLLLALRRR
jgi:hypothetical protein